MDPKKNPFLNDRLGTFGRMTFPTPSGDRFGVSRVWYKEDHPHAGNCEVELIDGTSVLVPVEDVQFAPNWDVTPEEGRFVGAEFFRPNFLDGATGQNARLFHRDHGVIVPSDLARLRELTGTVRADQTVDWYSHGCNEFRGRLTVESVDGAGMRMKGGKGAHPTRCTWPTTGEAQIGPQYASEFLVEGRTLHLMRVPPRRYGRSVDKAVSIAFGKG